MYSFYTSDLNILLIYFKVALRTLHQMDGGQRRIELPNYSSFAWVQLIFLSHLEVIVKLIIDRVFIPDYIPSSQQYLTPAMLQVTTRPQEEYFFRRIILYSK